MMDKPKAFNYSSKNRRKFLLLAHLIISTKYRRKTLIKYGEFMKQSFVDISMKYEFEVVEIEVDKNHIHVMIQYKPDTSISQIVRVLKQESTIEIWKKFDLSNYYWKEKTFWGDGYFVCSVGNSSPETIQNYIKNQG